MGGGGGLKDLLLLTQHFGKLQENILTEAPKVEAALATECVRYIVADTAIATFRLRYR